MSLPFRMGEYAWYTDKLAVDVSGCLMMEIVTGECNQEIPKQVRASSTQVELMETKGTVVVVLERACLEKLRKQVADCEISLGEGLIAALQSRGEKLQMRNLLLRGKLTAYHRNSTA